MTTENIASNQTAKINTPTPGMTKKCCPFCGSYDLVAGYWTVDDEEVDAWECNNCKAGAPQRVWNQRAPTPIHEDHQHLLKFYEVTGYPDMVSTMLRLIRSLQSRLPGAKDDQPGRVREG